ncbi:MAG: hypothetical protein IJ792_04315 [Oscillospiraceae bacterium]|nr:hypothetical protein [Oscillospiraceae bacterium]
MKRMLALMLALLLVLSGCAGGNVPAPNTPDAPSAAESGSPDGPTDTDEAPQPEPVDLETIAIAGAPGFYDLLKLPALADLKIIAMTLEDEDHLILVSGDKAEEVSRFSLETGVLEPICTLPIQNDTDWISASIASVDPLVIYEYDEGKNYYIDSENQYHVIPQSEEDGMGYWDCVYVDDVCLWHQSASGIIWSQPLAGGAAAEIGQLPQDLYYFSMQGLTSDGTDLVFTATGPKGASVLVTVSRETGAVTGMYNAPTDGYGALFDAVSISCDYDASDYSLYHITVSDGRRQISTDFQLDLLSGEPDGKAPDFDSWMSEDSISRPWGRTLMTAWVGEEQHYLLWDYRELTPTAIEPVELTEYVLPEPATPESLTERARALEETYGIQIHMGQDIDAPYPDYTLSACEDVDQIDRMMDVMEEAFSLYPEDYFEQLGGSGIRGFSFYFSGAMTPIDPSVSISNPAALTCLVDGVELLAFDITGYITVQDVVHELTHVLDHWLWEDNVLDEEVWSSMNPEGFSYYYAYIDPNGDSYEWSGSSEYTTNDSAWYDGDTDSVYFIDAYSTTFPTEDRARLMEYLLSDVDYGPPDYFASDHLQEKLTYYFQCIRTKFDTTNWPEQTSWEQMLSEAVAKG